MEREEQYKKACEYINDKHKQQLGALWATMYACSFATRLNDSTKHKWLQASIYGYENEVGIVGRAASMHLEWPIEPKKGHHRSNFKAYKERLDKSKTAIKDLVDELEALRYYAEEEVQDYEWEDKILEVIDLICEGFNLEKPDEEDRLFWIRKMIKFKRTYNAKEQ